MSKDICASTCDVLVLIALSSKLGKCAELSEPSLLACIENLAVNFTDSETPYPRIMHYVSYLALKPLHL